MFARLGLHRLVVSFRTLALFPFGVFDKRASARRRLEFQLASGYPSVDGFAGVPVIGWEVLLAKATQLTARAQPRSHPTSSTAPWSLNPSVWKY